MNFKITSKQEISSHFINQNILDFAQASKFVQNSAYKRNKINTANTVFLKIWRHLQHKTRPIKRISNRK